MLRTLTLLAMMAACSACSAPDTPRSGGYVLVLPPEHPKLAVSLRREGGWGDTQVLAPSFGWGLEPGLWEAAVSGPGVLPETVTFRVNQADLAVVDIDPEPAACVRVITSVRELYGVRTQRGHKKHIQADSPWVWNNSPGGVHFVSTWVDDGALPHTQAWVASGRAFTFLLKPGRSHFAYYHVDGLRFPVDQGAIVVIPANRGPLYEQLPSGPSPPPWHLQTQLQAVVIHSVPSSNAAEGVERSKAAGRSYHFHIDPDGTVVQTQDVDLPVNGLPMASNAVHVALTDAGTPYSDAQYTSLAAMTRTFLAMFESIPIDYPRWQGAPVSGYIGERLRGVVAHTHLDPSGQPLRSDFDWERFWQLVEPEVTCPPASWSPTKKQGGLAARDTDLRSGAARER